MATSLGLAEDKAFQDAYLHGLEGVFGEQRARVIRAILLARHPRADTGGHDVDRVCFGLRHLLGH